MELVNASSRLENEHGGFHWPLLVVYSVPAQDGVLREGDSRAATRQHLY